MKNRNFRLYLFGNITSILGDIMLDIALALYVLQITNSATKFASIMAIEIVPKLLLGFFSGAIADRLDKKKLAIFLDFFRGAFLILLFILFLNGGLTVTAIYITVIVFSICEIFFAPSFISLLPAILKEDELVQGNAINKTLTECFNVLSPLVATLIFGAFGIGIILVIDAITFIVSAIIECFLEVNLKRNSVIEKVHIITEIIDGFKVSFKDVQMISLVANGAVTHLILTPFLMLGMPFLINNIIKAPPFYYGIVNSCATVGTLLATVAISIVGKKLNLSKGINYGILGMVISACLFIPLAFSGILNFIIVHKIVAVIYLSFINLCMYLSFGFYGVFFVSAYQSKTPVDYLGRFGAMFVTIISLARFLGLKVMGNIFDLNNLFLAVLILVFGMTLKIFVHIPYLKNSKKDELEKNTVVDLGWLIKK